MVTVLDDHMPCKVNTVKPVIYGHCFEWQSTMLGQYSKTCHLWTLFSIITCLVRTFYEIDMECNFIDLMFILHLFCKATFFNSQFFSTVDKLYYY